MRPNTLSYYKQTDNAKLTVTTNFMGYFVKMSNRSLPLLKVFVASTSRDVIETRFAIHKPLEPNKL